MGNHFTISSPFLVQILWVPLERPRIYQYAQAMHFYLLVYQSGPNISWLLHLNLSVVWEEIRDQCRFRLCILLISLSFSGSLYPSSFRRSRSGARLLNFSICPWKQDLKVSLALWSENAEFFQTSQWPADFRKKQVFGLPVFLGHWPVISRAANKEKRRLLTRFPCCYSSSRPPTERLVVPMNHLLADGWKLCWWLKRRISDPLYSICLSYSAPLLSITNKNIYNGNHYKSKS